MELQLIIMNDQINELQNTVSANEVNKFFGTSITNVHDLQILDKIRLSMVQNNPEIRQAINVLTEEMNKRGLS